ncbi:opine dehydrogenase-like [Ruditapes philippinarum]|uniref:opine dehydrogenase-like n=1 Tax=Ruditapes philippinarum TaxID=129788 RepID=UPI00295AF826|nr:opine dehydrogenase-like [Ruditapes philippinarum]
MAGFSESKNVTIFGGGNGAHVLAGTSSLVKNAHVTVVDTFQDEAERWTNAMAANGFTMKYSNGQTKSQPAGAVNFKVTKEVEANVRNADIVILCMPAFLHEMVLTNIASYLQDKCVLVGLPGQAGFEYQALAILREHGKKCSVVSIETLPWACRIVKYGQEVEVLGTKEEIYASQIEQIKSKDTDSNSSPMGQVQTILGPKPVLKREMNIIKYTFLYRPTVHPPIMYAKWKNWDGKPLETAPLFYQGVDEEAVKYLDGATNEMIEVANVLASKYPNMDFSGISPMKECFIGEYPDQIEDKQTLLSCLKTNRAYDGLVHPMKKTADGKLEPDFKYRYLMEDVPYGLLIIRQIAGMVEVRTPLIDEIIVWAQAKLGTEYMKDGKLCFVDRKHGRLPMAYGINTIEEFVNFFE